MKRLTVLFLLLLIASVAFATPGDILRSQSLTNQPAGGVRGLAMDWDTGLIWVAGIAGGSNVRYTTMDPSTMSSGTWQPIVSSVYWVFDIGYGYEDNGTKYLLISDMNSPFTKLIDPADGSYSGGIPDYFNVDDDTDGCSVDWDSNDVYLSSYGNDEVVCYDGSHTIFTTIPGARNMGAAVGWGHLFILRTDTYYAIEVYQLDGTYIESITLADWNPGHWVMGLSCGQENVVGDNESLFFSDFITHQVHEIEVGDYTSSSSVESLMPELYTLQQNYPNPFNSSTTISFSLPEPAEVSLRIYDVLGRLVRVLMASESVAVGHHENTWNGTNESGHSVATGVYYCRLETRESSATKRMYLMK